jgi:hypothetical protein
MSSSNKPGIVGMAPRANKRRGSPCPATATPVAEPLASAAPPVGPKASGAIEPSSFAEDGIGTPAPTVVSVHEDAAGRRSDTPSICDINHATPVTPKKVSQEYR